MGYYQAYDHVVFFGGGVYFGKKVTIFSENSYFRTVFRDLKSDRSLLSELRQNTLKSRNFEKLFGHFFFRNLFTSFLKNRRFSFLTPLLAPGTKFRRETSKWSEILRREASKFEGIRKNVAFSRKIRFRNFFWKTRLFVIFGVILRRGDFRVHIGDFSNILHKTLRGGIFHQSYLLGCFYNGKIFTKM